jgi:hypothetical protein
MGANVVIDSYGGREKSLKEKAEKEASGVVDKAKEVGGKVEEKLS